MAAMRRWAIWGLSVVAVTAVTVPIGAVSSPAQAKAPARGGLAGGWTRLRLSNGWIDAPFATSPAAVRVISGIVRLKGAIASPGVNPDPFTLPAGFRPRAVVFVPVDLCNATNGRLQIKPDGQVIVQAENGAFSNAACLTSLDGVSFAQSGKSFTRLRPHNGWFTAPFGGSPAAVRVISGIVHFKGAIAAATGSNPVPFTLPAGFRPATQVDIPVDLCDANNGRLQIQPDGVVTVQAGKDASSNAATCFTSLDGASFALSARSFTRLRLQSGWTSRPFSTARPALRLISGIVHFEGAMATTGLNPVLFILPTGFRPRAAAFVPVDLCNATNGRLQIQPNGEVTVQAEKGAFSNAACFTSLDGASFAP